MAKKRFGGKKGQRVAIVAGLRTPFAKQWTAYKDVSALDLGKVVVQELLMRTDVDPAVVERVVYGQVVPSVSAPNIAREVVLGTSLPRKTDAYSVSRACATSYQSAINVTEGILAGSIEAGIAGGADSASDVPITVSKKLQHALIAASKARSVGQRLNAFRGLEPKDLVPVPPAIREPSTGEIMGESAEKMAKLNGISRAAQDELAHRSHVNAAKAWEEGRFDEEVMEVFVPRDFRTSIRRDNLVREDSSLEKYSKLRPAFDKKHGSVTAGNSSALTDGASALLLMREDRARKLGLAPLGYIRSWAFAALDPGWQLLMGPSFATPIALERAGLELADMGIVDMHEAFAAQVLSNTQAFESKTWAQEHLGRDRAIGEVDWETFNVNGGSIALGHPFAATGARQLTQTLNEMRRRDVEFGLVSACAAGGLGAAVVLEAA